MGASFKENTPWWLVLVGCAPVGVACFAYLYLLFYDRDKLQSEDYQIRKRSLELIGQKGGVSSAEAAQIELVVDPLSRAALQDKGGER